MLSSNPENSIIIDLFYSKSGKHWIKLEVNRFATEKRNACFQNYVFIMQTYL